MTIEHACMQVVHKPWGSTDLRPWSELQGEGIPIGELWFQRDRRDRSAPRTPAKVAVHERGAVHPGSPGRRLCAIDRYGARQDRGLVYTFRGARRQSCRRTEGATYRCAIASVHRGRVDCGPGSMAPGPAGRRRFRARRHNSCHRSGTGDCRDPAAKRRNLPSFRLWPTAGGSRLQRCGGRACRTRRMPIHSEAPY